MNERGVTLLEVLVAALALGLILLAVSSFYLSAARFDQENSAQTFLQRQATFVIDELNKQIQPATAATLQIGCPAYPAVSDANSLQATNSDPATGNSQTFCFHRDATFTQLLEEGPGGQRDLLAGAPATLSATTGGCPGSGGFCPALLTDNQTPANTVGVLITFRLRYRYPENPSGYQTMTFTTTIAARN